MFYPPSAARARLLAASAASLPLCRPSNWTNCAPDVRRARTALQPVLGDVARRVRRRLKPPRSAPRPRTSPPPPTAPSAFRNDVRALSASCSHRWAFSSSPSSYFSHRLFPRSVLFASSWPLALWSLAISTDLATPAQPQMPLWSKSLARPSSSPSQLHRRPLVVTSGMPPVRLDAPPKSVGRPVEVLEVVPAHFAQRTEDGGVRDAVGSEASRARRPLQQLWRSRSVPMSRLGHGPGREDARVRRVTSMSLIVELPRAPGPRPRASSRFAQATSVAALDGLASDDLLKRSAAASTCPSR